MRLHVLFQMKTMYFYQLVDLTSFDSWEKYIQEEIELEDKYEIANIWTTIKTFKSIV